MKWKINPPKWIPIKNDEVRNLYRHARIRRKMVENGHKWAVLLSRDNEGIYALMGDDMTSAFIRFINASGINNEDEREVCWNAIEMVQMAEDDYDVFLQAESIDGKYQNLMPFRNIVHVVRSLHHESGSLDYCIRTLNQSIDNGLLNRVKSPDPEIVRKLQFYLKDLQQ